MKSMIYYPGFEVRNINWLKFALLYFDELRPIIPDIPAPEHFYLSKNAIRVMGETDFIRPYRPDYKEACNASAIACEEFDRYLQNPKRYSYFFTKTHNINMMDIWRNPFHQICKLYDGKFSSVFHDYCIENGIAVPFSGGIIISKDLAFVYMSFLADVISKKMEYEMFTDHREYDDLLLKNDQNLMDAQDCRYKIVREEIEFSVPTNINKIPLEDIIRLRNDRNFDNYRRAYVKEMQKYLKARESDPEAVFDDQLKIRKDLQKILGSLFGPVISFYLTSTSILSLINGDVSPAFALATAYFDIKEFADIRNVPKYLEELKTKTQAKRYLGQLRKTSAPFQAS